MKSDAPGIVVRKGNSGDFDDWNSIDDVCFPELKGASKAVQGGFLAANIDSPVTRTVFQVAEMDGRVIGYSHTVPVRDATARVGNLDMIAVLPEFRNNRVGTDLLTATQKAAMKADYDVLVATIKSSSSSFFANSGWTVAPEGSCLMWPRNGGGETYYPDFAQGYDRVCYIRINAEVPNYMPLTAMIAKEREYL